MATLMGDISEAGDLVSRIPGDFVVSLVTAVGTIILLLYLNRPLGLVVIVLMAFKVVHTIVISGKLRNQYGRNRREFGHLSALGEENLSGIRMIRAYSAEHHIIEAFQRVADAYLRAREQTFFLVLILVPASASLRTSSSLPSSSWAFLKSAVVL